MVLEQLSWMLQNELHPHIYTNFHFKWRLVRNVKTETKISKNTTQGEIFVAQTQADISWLQYQKHDPTERN